jgi:hypothetical protein
MGMQEEMKGIVEAISHGRGRFALGELTDAEKKMGVTNSPFVLAVGAVHVANVRPRAPDGRPRDGHIITIGMTRDHLLELRGKIDGLLGFTKRDPVYLAVGEKHVQRAAAFMMGETQRFIEDVVRT